MAMREPGVLRLTLFFHLLVLPLTGSGTAQAKLSGHASQTDPVHPCRDHWKSPTSPLLSLCAHRNAAGRKSLFCRLKGKNGGGTERENAVERDEGSWPSFPVLFPQWVFVVIFVHIVLSYFYRAGSGLTVPLLRLVRFPLVYFKRSIWECLSFVIRFLSSFPSSTVSIQFIIMGQLPRDANPVSTGRCRLCVYVCVSMDGYSNVKTAFFLN